MSNYNQGLVLDLKAESDRVSRALENLLKYIEAPGRIQTMGYGEEIEKLRKAAHVALERKRKDAL